MNIFNRPRAGTSIGKSLGATVITFAIFAALLVQRFWPDPKNEKTAEGIVTSAYQTACTGASEEQYDHHEWEQAERQYGRVVSWHITGHYMTPFRDQWRYEVNVVRERAETKEEVQATAGPSQVYGYYASISHVTIESANPNPIN